MHTPEEKSLIHLPPSTGSPQALSHAANDLAHEAMYLEGWNHPEIWPWVPANLQVVRHNQLSIPEQEILGKAVGGGLRLSYSPRTFNHRFAGLAALGPDKESIIEYDVNFDASMSEKFCAEAGAARNLYEIPFQRLESIVTIAERYTQNGPTMEPPVAPCGSCRDVLLARSPHDGELLMRVDKDTRLVMSTTDLSRIQVCTLGDLSPLSFLNGSFDPSQIRQLKVDGLSILPRRRLTSHGYLRDQKEGNLVIGKKEIRSLLEAAEKSCVPSLGRMGFGASVLSLNGDIESARTSFPSPATGEYADVRVMSRLLGNYGTNLIKGVAICGADSKYGGGITLPSGKGLQYLFDAAQRVGIDLPVFLMRHGKPEIVICPISRLYALGEGPLNSKSAAQALPRYRLLNGKVFE